MTIQSLAGKTPRSTNRRITISTPESSAVDLCIISWIKLENSYLISLKATHPSIGNVPENQWKSDYHWLYGASWSPASMQGAFEATAGAQRRCSRMPRIFEGCWMARLVVALASYVTTDNGSGRQLQSVGMRRGTTPPEYYLYWNDHWNVSKKTTFISLPIAAYTISHT